MISEFASLQIKNTAHYHGLKNAHRKRHIFIGARINLNFLVTIPLLVFDILHMCGIIPARNARIKLRGSSKQHFSDTVCTILLHTDSEPLLSDDIVLRNC